MKQIKVNDRCNGCGLCIVNCPYLKENADGNAEYIAGTAIKAEDLKAVEKVISECPQSALEIIDAGSTNKTGKAGVEDVVSMLKRELEAFKVQRVTLGDIKMNTKNIYIPVPSSSLEYRRDYNSEREARNAAINEFNRLCYSESAYGPILKKFFVEYKVNVLKPYYTVTDTEDSVYYKYNQQIRALLANAYAEIVGLVGDKIPESWKSFSAYPNKRDNMAIETLTWFDDRSMNSGIISELRSSGDYTSIDWYIDHNIDIDYSEEYAGEGMFGKSKYKNKYYFTGFSSAARDYINDLKDAIISQSGEIVENILDSVNYALEHFEKQITGELRKKISELEGYVKSM